MLKTGVDAVTLAVTLGLVIIMLKTGVDAVTLVWMNDTDQV